MDIREARKQFDLILSANDAANSENNDISLPESNNIDVSIFVFYIYSLRKRCLRLFVKLLNIAFHS